MLLARVIFAALAFAGSALRMQQPNFSPGSLPSNERVETAWWRSTDPLKQLDTDVGHFSPFEPDYGLASADVRKQTGSRDYPNIFDTTQIRTNVDKLQFPLKDELEYMKGETMGQTLTRLGEGRVGGTVKMQEMAERTADLWSDDYQNTRDHVHAATNVELPTQEQLLGLTDTFAMDLPMIGGGGGQGANMLPRTVADYMYGHDTKAVMSNIPGGKYLLPLAEKIDLTPPHLPELMGFPKSTPKNWDYIDISQAPKLDIGNLMSEKDKIAGEFSDNWLSDFMNPHNPFQDMGRKPKEEVDPELFVPKIPLPQCRRRTCTVGT